ncbi:PE-PPE domain-containing protein [Mycolicibacterium sp. F2034L]|uniref:PE-PPE domain-containing protein n=1 Tax=Mycolicibacterium sp. F2034L TaxID=2926422 RepID=UPI001FF188F3|nr:PE-PPE domain-containing protein [Mycolicibacterium sp. F2034L]MCK0174905.1 PE-PPE domain-containing protein [Mycolicibacterium sp. F2034L]
MAGALLLAPTAIAPTADAATAYTVEPLGGTDRTPNLLNGSICAAYTCVKVPTEATVDPSHSEGVLGEEGPISRGALTLDDMLREDSGEKLVFGFSQGAQIAGFWLRNYGPDTTVSRENTSFLLVGDPENTYGVPWAPRVPTNTGFAVTELWAQYDGWADWPDRFDLLAVANAVYGMFTIHTTAYNDLDLAAAEARGDVVTWKSEGITYKMVTEQNVPLLDPLRNIGLGWLADMVNDDLRDHIEAQYDRPSTQVEADARFGSGDDDDADVPPPAETETDDTDDPGDAGDQASQRISSVNRSAIDTADLRDSSRSESRAVRTAPSRGDTDSGDGGVRRAQRTSPAAGASSASSSSSGVEKAARADGVA